MARPSQADGNSDARPGRPRRAPLIEPTPARRSSRPRQVPAGYAGPPRSAAANGRRRPALRLADDAGREYRGPAVVLVSNNPYPLDNPLAPGTRPALDTGRLGIVVLGVPGDTSLGPGRAWTAPRLEVSAPAAVHAGVDGEAVDLSPPLRFAIRPAALRVRISSRHPGASPSARLHPPGPPPPPLGGQDQ